MTISDASFEHIYNKKLLRKLDQKFGAFTRKHVDLSITSQSMLNLTEKMKVKRRRGEVVMVIPNKKGEIWLHTKAFYPPGIYRLMTGGLDPGEKPHLALKREVAEETGFKAEIKRCLAVITYTLKPVDNNDVAIPFVSYVFLTKPQTGVPQPVDPTEYITDFQAVPVAGLREVAHQLRSIEGHFADWGIFRAVAHEVVYNTLA